MAHGTEEKTTDRSHIGQGKRNRKAVAKILTAKYYRYNIMVDKYFIEIL